MCLVLLGLPSDILPLSDYCRVSRLMPCFVLSLRLKTYLALYVLCPVRACRLVLSPVPCLFSRHVPCLVTRLVSCLVSLLYLVLSLVSPGYISLRHRLFFSVSCYAVYLVILPPVFLYMVLCGFKLVILCFYLCMFQLMCCLFFVSCRRVVSFV